MGIDFCYCNSNNSKSFFLKLKEMIHRDKGFQNNLYFLQVSFQEIAHRL
jgi:hypothetical protein